MEMPDLDKNRFIYWVDETMLTPHGYRPVMIVENTPGFFTQGGGDVEPWFWGNDLIIAKRIARERNEKMGLSEDEQDLILISSILN